MSADDELVFEIAYFYAEERQRLAPDVIQRVLLSIEGVQAKPGRRGEKVFEYSNRDTDVTCNFVVFPPEHEREVGLSMEIMMPRSLVFALEVLPLAVQAAREMRLKVAVMSPEGEHAEPDYPTVEDLFVRWQEANLEEIKFLEREGHPVFRLPGGQLEALWEYNLLRGDLVRRYGRQRIDVPRVDLLVHRETRHVVRSVEWRRLTPLCFPDVDWVLLKEPPAPLKSGKIVLASLLLEKAKFAFRDLSQPIFHHFFEKASVKEELREVLLDLPHVDPAGYRSVGLHQVVDEHIQLLKD